MGLSPILLTAQNPNGNYNPYVDGATITPSPLVPLENGGRGVLGFNIGNSGTDLLKVYTDHYMILTITLSNGISEMEDPLSAISGSYAGHFSWSYQDGTYTARQIGDIPPASEGDIKIAFEVAKNSSSPGANGFNVNITPSPYHTTSNIQGDDAVSTYTYTGEATFSDRSGLSPFSIYPNPSGGEIILHLEGESGSYLLEIVAPNGGIVKQDVLNLKGTPVSLVLNGLSPGIVSCKSG